MGLDMYAYVASKNDEGENVTERELAYWRKHPNLHGWMEELWKYKMAGHSHAKNVMHQKSKTEAKRAKIFGKLAREIMVAAKQGLPDPAHNPRLRAAIIDARKNNLPRDRMRNPIHIKMQCRPCHQIVMQQQKFQQMKFVVRRTRRFG